MQKQILQNIKKYGNLPSLLKELRTEKGYSIQSLSTHLNISTTSLRNYENGDSFPDAYNLNKILNFFEIDSKSLMSNSYAKTSAIKDLLEEEYFTIQHRISILTEELRLYQNLADNIRNIIDTTEVEVILNPVTTYNDENYQYSGSGDTFIETDLYLEKGRYRMTGYYKPGKAKSYSDLYIYLFSKDDDSAGRAISYGSPYQPFSKVVRIDKTCKYNINVECGDQKKWAFSILPV